MRAPLLRCPWSSSGRRRRDHIEALIADYGEWLTERRRRRRGAHRRHAAHVADTSVEDYRDQHDADIADYCDPGQWARTGLLLGYRPATTVAAIGSGLGLREFAVRDRPPFPPDGEVWPTLQVTLDAGPRAVGPR